MKKVGAKRKTAMPGTTLKLDERTPTPVVIAFRTENGSTADARTVETINENDRSVVAVLHFGPFDAVFGGDLSLRRSNRAQSADDCRADGRNGEPEAQGPLRASVTPPQALSAR